MTTDHEQDDLRPYFTDDEWTKMPDCMKQRYVNIKRNYDTMVTLGLRPAVPHFMCERAAWNAPAKRDSNRESTASSSQPAATKRLNSEGTEPETPTKASTLTETTGSKSQLEESSPSSSSIQRRYPKRARKQVICTQTDGACDDKNSDSESSSSPMGFKPMGRKRKTTGSNSSHVSGVRPAVNAWCLRDQPSKCPAHGPSGYDKATTLSVESLERAKESLPDGLVIFCSRLRGAQLGVFTLASLNEGVCFGPYKSSNVEERSREELPSADSGPQRAIWMRYVNCAPTEDRANLVPLNKDGATYYSMCKTVGPVEELLVWCNGSSTVSQSAKTETQQRPSFACPVCSREFPKSSSVKKHMVAHTREMPHQCAECGERFGGVNALKHHRRMHSSEMSYKCPTCGEGFGHSANLSNHLWIHRDSKPYACAVCGREYSTLLYAKRHEYRKHGKL